MNSIFAVNTQKETAKGTGLPFYRRIQYQYRNWINSIATKVGFWGVPSNKLPTFQLWNSNELDTLEVYKVTDTGDTLMYTVPNTLYTEFCTNEGDKIYTVKDDFNQGFDCGLYYIRFYNSTNTNLGDFYSEIFEIGYPFHVTIATNLVATAFNFRMFNSDNITVTEFKYNLDPPAGTGVDVIVSAPYDGFVNLNALGIGQTSSLTFTTTTNVGVFIDKYSCTNFAGTITVVKKIA